MNLPTKYNELSPKERRLVREEYIHRQGGNCYYCGAPLSGPPNDSVRKMRITESLYPVGFFTYPVHLHHDHDTGLTIGAVHNKCNAVLWEYEGQ